MEQLTIIGLIVVIILGIIGTECYHRMKLRAKIKMKWGTLPDGRLMDSEESLKNAWCESKKYQHYDSEIDEITWYDLDGETVFERVNATYSSVGSQALYQRLRNFNFSIAAHQRLETLIQYYQQNPEKREKIQFQFACLGKKDNNFVESYLTETRQQAVPHFLLYLFLGCLPLMLVVFFLFFKSTITIMLLLGAILFNVLFYLIKKEKLDRELASMGYLIQTIACGKTVAKIDTPFQEELKKSIQPLKSLTRVGISFRAKSTSETEVLFDYVSMLFMLPFISYHFVLKKLENYETQAKEVWRLLGELEVAAAVLNFRLAMPDTCQPIFSKKIAVHAENLYHPLLSEPISNNVNWQQNTLVTGSNASGKSTYVKSIAISCFLSLTIHTALATKFQLPFGHVLTSMAVEDDIFEGDSYFVAEIKSVKRVLELVQTKATCFCFIDEILKGTNTIERIAASSSMVDWLGKYPSLVFVATHDIELTEILQSSCCNLHFEEQVTAENGVTFDYQVKSGPATTRNAIQLLQVLNYPETIVAQAKMEAAYFDKQRTWKKLVNKTSQNKK